MEAEQINKEENKEQAEQQGTFKLVLAETKLLKDSLKVIKELITEACFTIDREGIKICCLDSANICLTDFKLLSSAFSEYNLNKQSSFKIGLNIKNFYDKIKKIKKEEYIILEYDKEKHGFKLILTFKGNNTKTAKIHIIDIQEEQDNKVDLEFKNLALITTNSKDLKKDFEFITEVAESFILKTYKDKFIFSCVDEFEQPHDLIIEGGRETNTFINDVEREVKSKYSAQYFKKMLEAELISDRVILKYSDDFPLQISFINKNKVELKFILAPRVDE